MNHERRTGTIEVQGGRAAIVFVRRLPFPIHRVWAAITDPQERAAWFGPMALDPKVGGKIALTAEGPPVPRNMRQITGHILVWDPPHVFEHEWRQPLIGDTVVRYELTEDGGATLLRFTHFGLKISDADGYRPGEHAFLDRMEAHLVGRPLPRWAERYAKLLPEYRDAGPRVL